MPSQVLVVFTLPGCPACHRCREYLSQKGVIFEERSVAEPEFRRQLVEDYKAHATPTLVCGEDVIVGFDQGRIDSLIDRYFGD
jgi:glutaredoxin